MNIPLKRWTIYTREACGYCDMAKAELKRLGIEYTIVEQNDNTIKELSEKLNKSMFTYPQIFTEEGKSVGGFDNLLDYTEQMD